MDMQDSCMVEFVCHHSSFNSILTIIRRVFPKSQAIPNRAKSNNDMAAICAKHRGKGKTLVKCHTVEHQVFRTPPPTESEATKANTSGSDAMTSASSIFSSAAAQAGNESNPSLVPSENELDESLMHKSIANTMQSAASSTPSGSTNPKWAAAPIKKPCHHTAKKTNGF